MDLIKLNDDIAVGGQPSLGEMERLRRQGFRSIVNLRPAGEDADQPHPDRERDEARRLGMKYAHLPVKDNGLDDKLADLFAVVLTALEKPVFVHCATGARSGALTVSAMEVAGERDPDHAVETAEEHGVKLGSLERFVRQYLDRRSPEGMGRGRDDHGTVASALTDWMDRFAEDAREGRVAATSAGAGEGRDYGYLHYRTHDRRHSAVVFRFEPEGPHLRVFSFDDAPEEEIAELIDRATHRRADWS